MHSLKGQLTLRGVIIGCIGCVIITTASMYTALKLGALPWPILFAAIVSLFFLKILGRTNLNEVNVTHTVMSAGAMTAGGVAFTIPGIWILGYSDGVSWVEMLLVALCGVTLGLVCTIYLRRHFIESSGLEYPLGQATAQTLVAGDTGGKVGRKLFGSFGFAGIYAFIRDWFGAIPAMLLGGIQVPGVAFGIYNSPMLLAIGFLVGTGAIVAWLTGAVAGNFGLVFGGSALGFWDLDTGRQITSSLGMGLMMGCGVAIVVKVLTPAVRNAIRGMRSGDRRTGTEDVKRGGGRIEAEGSDESTAAEVGCTMRSASGDAGAWESEEGATGHTTRSVSGDANARESLTAGTDSTAGHTPEDATAQAAKPLWRRLTAGVAALMVASAALLLCFALELGPLPSLVIVLMVWITTAMGAQSVGQTSIDPMEIFGLVVLLIVAAFSDISQVQLFFVAGVIAVACGLTGDLMNDFKAGHILGTSPRAQWAGQLVGGILGALVSVAVLSILVQAYGPEAFGIDSTFVSLQATVVATMISGIPSVPAFVIGLIVGFALHMAGLPAMMVGLGVYLPFYLSFTAFLGLLVKQLYNFACRHRRRDLAGKEAAERLRSQEETGLIVASGLLGGESVAGVIVALASISLFLGG